MAGALEFIQYLEQLKSGAAAGTDGGAIGAEGINRALERLSENANALLDELNAARQGPRVVGDLAYSGGTLGWTGGALTVLFLSQFNAISFNTIAASSIPLSAGEVAYVVIDRTSAAVITVSVVTFAGYMALLAANDDRLDHVVIAMGVAPGLVATADGRFIRDGYALSNSGATDTQYGQQTEVTLIHENQKENLNLIMTRGGDIFWDSGAQEITFSEPLYLEFPASAAGDNYIAAGTYSVPAEHALYVTLTRDPGGSTDITGTVTNVALSTGVPDTDNTFVLAIHKNLDNRIYLADGTALSNGETVKLGGARIGVQWHYQEAGNGLQTTSFGVDPYRVGTGELMVYRNGIKAQASKAYWDGGTYPGGGSLNVLSGTIRDGDDYVEEDPGTGIGTRIIWIRDLTGAPYPETLGVVRDPAVNDPIRTWPDTDDIIEAFVGVQGQAPTISIPDGIYGFELVWTPDSSTLKTAGGYLVSGGEQYNNNGATPIVALTTDATVEGPLVNTYTEQWMYAYLAPAVTVGDSPVMILSENPPDDSADGAGVHPSQPGYRFLTSVYVTAGGDFNAMTKRGSWVQLGEDPSSGANGPDITSNFAGKLTGLFVTVDVSNNLPATYVGGLKIHVRAITEVDVAVGDAVRLEVKETWESYNAREMWQIKPGNAGGRVNFEFWPLAPDGQFDTRFQIFGSTQGMSTVLYGLILGYSEGRHTSGDTLE
jgi:hypothetical protein